jgi:arginase family enzyme
MDEVDIVAVGIRALTAEERALIRERDGITTIFAEEMWADDAWIDRAMAALGDDVYITFDVDYFDPALMPATGTPEPGGPPGTHAEAAPPRLRREARGRRRRGGARADPGNAAPDFAGRQAGLQDDRVPG